MSGILQMKQKRTAKTKALKEETSNVYGNGHTSLFADVIDAIENDRKPYVDAVAGRNASGSRIIYIQEPEDRTDP